MHRRMECCDCRLEKLLGEFPEVDTITTDSMINTCLECLETEAQLDSKELSLVKAQKQQLRNTAFVEVCERQEAERKMEAASNLNTSLRYY